jgi:predicted nucleotidyltransferase
MSLVGFYLDVLGALDNNNVEYMLVGGHAVNYHGYVRATIDMDIWVNSTEANIEKLFKSFLQLGYKEDNCKAAIVNLKENHIIKIPKDKSLIDLMDSYIIKNDFDKSYKNHEILKVNNVEIKVIGFEDLIACKYKSNRPKDLLDVKELKSLKDLREKDMNELK